MQNIINSPIQQITFKNQNFYIKRDDLLHRDFSGNKARKFYYFFENEFSNIKKVIVMVQINQMQCIHYLFYVN